MKNRLFHSSGPLHNKMGDKARDILEEIAIICGAKW